MVVYSYYPGDTRIRREANALIENDIEVDVICLRGENQATSEIFEKVNIHRLNIRKTRGTLFNYFFLYFIFFILSFIKGTNLFLKNKHNVIHIHNMPNFIVFVGLIPKLFGAKIILDQHDPSPEILISLSNKTEGSFLFKLAVFEEKISTWFADHIITTNIAFKDLFISRSCNEDKITIVMNSPQTSIFDKINIPKPQLEDNRTKKFRIMYNGTIIKRHGLDILVNSIKILKDKIPDIELHIFGKGEYLSEVLEKVEILKLNDHVKYRGTFLIDKIAEEISQMDMGVVPNRFNVFTNLNFPVRIFEFIYFKKPIVVPKTRGISDYFDDDSIFYFQAEDVNDLVNVILSIYYKSVDVNKVIENGYNVYQKNSWEIQSKNLLEVYNKLIKYH
jgi:glycosyltransferase involved in cell wall biosynthesis